MFYNNIVLFYGVLDNVENSDKGQKLTIKVNESYYDNEKKECTVVTNDYFVNYWNKDDDLSMFEGQTLYFVTKLIYRKVKSDIAVFKNDAKKDFEYGKFEFKYDSCFRDEKGVYKYLNESWGCKKIGDKNHGDIIWKRNSTKPKNNLNDE